MIRSRIDNYNVTGGGFTNPYTAIAGLNSLWVPDGRIVIDAATRQVAAVQCEAPTQPVPYVDQSEVARQPVLAALTPSRDGFQFTAASSQFLNARNDTDDIVTDNGALTLFAVIKTNAAIANATIYARGYLTSRWLLMQDPFGGGKIAFGLNGFSGFVPTFGLIQSNGVLTDGAPHRIIVVYNPALDPGPTMHMYVDGAAQVQTANLVGPLNTSNDRVSIGAEVGGAGGGASAAFWEGLLGDIGSYGRALSGAEVTQLDALIAARFGL